MILKNSQRGFTLIKIYVRHEIKLDIELASNTIILEIDFHSSNSGNDTLKFHSESKQSINLLNRNV